MQGLYLIIFQVFIIIFYGIFIRTSTDDTSLLTYLSTISTGFYFLLDLPLAFTAVSLRYKMFDWSMLTNLLYVLVIAFQINTLWVMFWISCFDGFSTTSTFTSTHVIAGIQATLCVLVTCFQFVGQINTTQLFVLSMVEVFAFALNWVIEYKGIQALSAGGVMTTFLFGYVFSLPIRWLKFKNENPFEQEKEKYFTLTLKFIGLVLLIFLWPSFNVMTSIPDLSLSNINTTTALLLEESYLQTFLALMAAIITTFSLRIYGQRVQIDQFINSIILTGLLIGASAEAIIDPFASILLGVLGPILHLLYEKYLAQFHMKGYALDKVLVCVLSAAFCSIFVAGRSGRSPELAVNHSTQAGYQFACLIVSGLFAGFFGLIAGFLLSKINALNGEISNKDSSIWLIDQEVLPLYSDDPLMGKIYEIETSRKMKKEQDAFNLKQSFIAEKVKENSELGKILKQQIDYESRIK